jgi:hypothetical protein
MLARPRGLFVEDAALEYALRPGFSGISRSPEWEVPVAINALGLRERELPVEGPGERRVLVLGDSFTFGDGVKAEEAYPRRIEAELEAAGSGLRVVNAGVPGYGMRKEALFFQRIGEVVAAGVVFEVVHEEADQHGVRRQGVDGR